MLMAGRSIGENPNYGLSSMPILQWSCAHGEAKPVTLACARCVEIAPHDDRVDTNAVRIKGAGIIESFGEGPPIVKRVMFPAGVTLIHNPPRIELLTERNRVIKAASVGTYACVGGDAWYEISFSASGPDEPSRRIEELEQRLAVMERRIAELEVCESART